MSIATLMTTLFLRFEWQRLQVRSANAESEESNLPPPSGLVPDDAYLNAHLQQVAYGFGVRGLV
ncbi:MAG: hypothetical protein L0Z53_00185 [Acidobacteriales bacterium]|nr:hypothetical protein [Terriglobales bacterium]